MQNAVGHRYSEPPAEAAKAAEEAVARELKRRPVLTAIEVLSALLLLVIASDAFTNAVEWIGALYGLTRSAAGAVVAAIGSSLPETMIAVVALLVLRDPASQAVGIGAVLGAPFMLATVVFAIVGGIAYFRGAVWTKTGGSLAVEPRAALVGLALFMLTFAFVVGASFDPTPVVRIVASGAVIIAYLAYLRYHMRRDTEEMDESPPPLRFRPNARRPAAVLVFTQMTVSLVVTVLASRWFVSSLTAASAQAGIPPLIVSLFVSPVATELPEAMNVILWMRRGLDELAVSNVIGAMIFQTSVASAIAMLASPWRLDNHAYAACIATALPVAIVLLVASTRRRLNAVTLFACGLFYVAFVIYTLAVP